MNYKVWAALGVGAAAIAGAAIGHAAERVVVGRQVAVDPDAAEPFGSLHSEPLSCVTSDGTTLRVEIDAADPANSDVTVVFTHGYCLSMDTWYYQRRDLRGTARLVFWDQRGHGNSQKGPGGYGEGVFDRLGADLGAVLDQYAPTGDVVLVSHSMGGMTTMALAQQRPELFGERIRGVALLGTSAGGLGDHLVGLPAPLARVLNRLAPIAANGVAANEVLASAVTSSASDLALVLTRRYAFASAVRADVNEFTLRMLTSTPPDVVAEFLPAFAALDATDSLGPFAKVDTVVVVGAGDAMTPPAHSGQIAAGIDGAELVTISDAGHMLMLEQPDEVTAVITDLVERVRAERARD